MFRKTVDLCKTVNLCKTVDIRKAPNIRKVPNIRRILLPLDGRNRIYGVRKACEDKASRPVLDAEEVTVLLSISVKA